MPVRIANAPCSWGVEFADAPNNPPWEQVVKEIHQAGYSGMELGPLGYLPEDAAVLHDVLSVRQLQIVAGTLFQHFHNPDKHAAIIEFTRRNCALLSQLNAEYMVVISHVTSPRTEQAGQKKTATRLDAKGWGQLIYTIDKCAEICLDHNITPTLHPHTGSYIEYEDELTKAMEDLSTDNIKLCVDTGHCFYAGMDPASVIRNYAGRVAYVHMKDITPNTYEEVINNGIDFYSAVKKGVFCPIGQGAVNFKDVKTALYEVGFDGWVTIEQDIDPLSGNGPLQYAIDSRQYVTDLFLQG